MDQRKKMENKSFLGNKIIILGLIIVLVCGFLLYNKLSKKNKKEEEKHENTGENSVEKSSKIEQKNNKFIQEGVEFNYQDWEIPTVKKIDGQINIISKKNGYKLEITKILGGLKNTEYTCLEEKNFTKIDENWVKIKSNALSQASGFFYVLKTSAKDNGYSVENQKANFNCPKSAFAPYFSDSNNNFYTVYLNKSQQNEDDFMEGQEQIPLNDNFADEIVKSIKLK